jgi:hypothetical protein
MVNIYGINLFYLFNSYTKDAIIYILKVFWSKYQCGHGPEDYRENSTHTQSIKLGCLASFLIKRLYTRPDVAKITIYRKAHTRINGHLHMVTRNPFIVCFVMLHACHKH